MFPRRSDMKTVLITGGTRGIGRAAALRFTAEGFAVVANYTKNKSAAETLEEEIKKSGGTVMIVRADVADAADREKLVSEALSLTGKIDVLVNNAGIADSGLFTDLAGERAARLYAVDLLAPVELTRLVLPHMIHEKSGAIVNLSSMWGQVGASCEVDYSTAKAGIIGFTKALAKEVAPSGIRVNCVAPGLIDTEMNSNLSREDFDAFAEEIPMERAGTADEVAECIYFLAAGGNYLTGQVISPNGGYIV